MSDEVVLNLAEAEALAIRACLAAGATEATARSLVDATLSAALYGPATLGFPHMVDYLNSFREGRINGGAEPSCTRPYPAFFVADADRGIAQLGFDRVFDELVAVTRNFGVAVFTQKNSYTAGELGYYVRRLAGEGIVGIAATNANAMVVAKAGGPAVYSTNPMALGFPLGEGSLPLIIDQASSATAYVNIVAAAAEGRAIPAGWAVDEAGNDTQDAARALGGALLPFGGRKGANVALMVEMLSAGLSGGPWSLDTPSFREGSDSPAVGLTVVAMMPGCTDDGLVERARRQADRLQQHGMFMPGVSGIEYPRPATESLKVPRAVFEAVVKIAGT
ncbi:Ldh family oxidoreductase [Rhizobium redzepovicii]|uniref:Ldh family oxidoreductase n=1 Tax=Rhizobium redzepovicii TaxID=2867518 RepID=UPI002870F404|nr:Ldh family oxidoreductase [Rhizobium redzepovicii]MDR9780792.1 Ldh family oxidoreductase [Rhizobium redzepovicii]